MVWAVLVSVAGSSNADDWIVEAMDELQDCTYKVYANILQQGSNDPYWKKPTINIYLSS